MLTLGADNTLLNGDNLSAFTWVNLNLWDGKRPQGIKRIEHTEQDYGLTYAFPSFKVAGKDLTLAVSGQYWQYPSRRLGSHDWVTDLNALWAGPVTINMQYRHLWPHGAVKEGDYVYTSLSRPIPLEQMIGKPRGWEFSFTPEWGATFHHQFYEDFTGIGNTRGIGTLSATKGKWTVSAGAGYQFNTGGDKELRPNTPLVNGAINYKF